MKPGPSTANPKTLPCHWHCKSLDATLILVQLESYSIFCWRVQSFKAEPKLNSHMSTLLIDRWLINDHIYAFSFIHSFDVWWVWIGIWTSFRMSQLASGRDLSLISVTLVSLCPILDIIVESFLNIVVVLTEYFGVYCRWSNLVSNFEYHLDLLN